MLSYKQLVNIFKYQRIAGIEPATKPWQGLALPLRHIRI